MSRGPTRHRAVSGMAELEASPSSARTLVGRTLSVGSQPLDSLDDGHLARPDARPAGRRPRGTRPGWTRAAARRSGRCSLGSTSTRIRTSPDVMGPTAMEASGPMAHRDGALGPSPCLADERVRAPASWPARGSRPRLAAHPREHGLGPDAMARPPAPARRSRRRLLRRPAAVVEDRELLLPIDARADDLAHSGWSPEDASTSWRRAGVRWSLLARHRAAGTRSPGGPPDRGRTRRRGPPLEPAHPLAGGDGLADMPTARPRGKGPQQPVPVRPGQGARHASRQPAGLPRPDVPGPGPEKQGFRVRGGISPA